jgi:hypothetical protein
MPFKYQKYLETLSIPCPPVDYKPESRVAFRFVFETTHEKYQNNFLPILIIKPARKNRFKEDSSQCQGYALSLFDSLAQANQKFINLTRKTNPYILKESLGTHLAQGIIEPGDGVVSAINEEGHFSLHEFEETDLQKKFRIISSLK